MLKRVFLNIVTLTIMTLTNSVWAHPFVGPPNNQDIDSLEKMANSNLSADDLAKFRTFLNELRDEPKTKASFGTKYTTPSHEMMTAQSAGNVKILDERLKWPLINGAIWNDDPEGLIGWRKSMFQLNIPKKWGLSFLYSKMLTALGIPIAKNDLLGRSHFGDMQFLHAMSNEAGTSPETTQKKIIDWCRFSYQVTTGAVNLDDKVIEHFNSVIISRTLTIKKLFKPKDNAPFFALGTIAHLIQDSYSQAHVRRDDNDNIVAYLVYQNQNSDAHEKLDEKKEYVLSGGWTKAVEHVGQVLEFAINKAPWTDVETFLRNKVFRLSDRAQSSSGGGV